MTYVTFSLTSDITNVARDALRNSAWLHYAEQRAGAEIALE